MSTQPDRQCAQQKFPSGLSQSSLSVRSTPATIRAPVAKRTIAAPRCPNSPHPRFTRHSRAISCQSTTDKVFQFTTAVAHEYCYTHEICYTKIYLSPSRSAYRVELPHGARPMGTAGNGSASLLERRAARPCCHRCVRGPFPCAEGPLFIGGGIFLHPADSQQDMQCTSG